MIEKILNETGGFLREIAKILPFDTTPWGLAATAAYEALNGWDTSPKMVLERAYNQRPAPRSSEEQLQQHYAEAVCIYLERGTDTRDVCALAIESYGLESQVEFLHQLYQPSSIALRVWCRIQRAHQ